MLRRLGVSILLFCGLLWLADIVDPLPLPKDDMARGGIGAGWYAVVAFC